MFARSLFFAALAAAALAAPAAAQQAPAAGAAAQGIRRIPLQKFDVPGTNYETVIGIAEIAPNASVGRHTHPGVESGFLLEGEFTLMVDGQPEKRLKAGESYVVPNAVVHDARAGPAGGKVIATYVVEKGKPLASPAP